jgi:hypothetical protein
MAFENVIGDYYSGLGGQFRQVNYFWVKMILMAMRDED